MRVRNLRKELPHSPKTVNSSMPPHRKRTRDGFMKLMPLLNKDQMFIWKTVFYRFNPIHLTFCVWVYRETYKMSVVADPFPINFNPFKDFKATRHKKGGRNMHLSSFPFIYILEKYLSISALTSDNTTTKGCCLQFEWIDILCDVSKSEWVSPPCVLPCGASHNGFLQRISCPIQTPLPSQMNLITWFWFGQSLKFKYSHVWKNESHDQLQ